VGPAASCGTTWHGPQPRGLTTIAEISRLREAFWQDVRVTGQGGDLNKHLEMAGRVADFFELGELMARDALMREESCGGHFREEHQTPEGEAKRDDANFAFVAAWEHAAGADPVLHREPLVFENVELKTRSYK
jgi:succinate dehydrogenase / fumarate reductase flavoprotein subunit